MGIWRFHPREHDIVAYKQKRVNAMYCLCQIEIGLGSVVVKGIYLDLLFSVQGAGVLVSRSANLRVCNLL